MNECLPFWILSRLSVYASFYVCINITLLFSIGFWCFEVILVGKCKFSTQIPHFYNLKVLRNFAFLNLLPGAFAQKYVTWSFWMLIALIFSLGNLNCPVPTFDLVIWMRWFNEFFIVSCFSFYLENHVWYIWNTQFVIDLYGDTEYYFIFITYTGI